MGRRLERSVTRATGKSDQRGRQHSGKLLKFFTIKRDTKDSLYWFSLPAFDLSSNSYNSIIRVYRLFFYGFFLFAGAFRIWTSTRRANLTWLFWINQTAIIHWSSLTNWLNILLQPFPYFTIGQHVIGMIFTLFLHLIPNTGIIINQTIIFYPVCF